MRKAIILLAFALGGCSGDTASLPSASRAKFHPLVQEICRRAEQTENWKEAKGHSGATGLNWFYSDEFTDGKVNVYRRTERWSVSYGFSVKDAEPLCLVLSIEEIEFLRRVAESLFLRLNKVKVLREQRIAEKKRKEEADKVLHLLTKEGAP